MSDAGECEVASNILRLKKRIEDTSVSVDELLDVLDSLETLKLTRALLAQTKIGISVGKLRKHQDATIAQRAKSLVDIWREEASKEAKKNVKHQDSKDSETSPVSESTTEPRPVRKESESTAIAVKSIKETTKYNGPKVADEKRNKVRALLFTAFIDGVNAEQREMLECDVCERLIAQIETALNDHHNEKNKDSKGYATQLRSLKANLQDPKNPEFNARIYLGAIPVEKLATMLPTEMASDAKKKERQKVRKDLMEACQSDWDLRNVKRAKGQFPCGKCRSDNTTYFQMQTRSADEPMTTYVTCLNCGHRWKF